MSDEWWRRWPNDADARKTASWYLVAVLGYVVVISAIRFVPMFDPWSFDGDQAQAVWHYWRYCRHGAYPPGDLLTDYAFVMHAPAAWWLMMSTLTTILRSPLWAAKLLNLVAYFGTCGLLFRAVSRKSNGIVGLAAVVLLLRNNNFYQLTAGGYARSFGPLLVVLFLVTFLERRHKLTLAVLVLQAALYPSVVMPCGIAYGLYVVAAGPTMRDRLKRMAGMFVAGLLIIGFGLYQDLLAPSWWGSVVSEQEALRMPAWGRGGRIHEAPLRPWIPEVSHQLENAFFQRGFSLTPHATAWLSWHHALPLLVLVAAGIVATFVIRRRKGSFVDPVPWELGLVFVGTMCSYVLARILAFKLYFPYRVLAHVIPYLFYFAIPVFSWSMFRNLLKPGGRIRDPGLRTGLFASLAVIVPMMLFFGTGFALPLSTYGSVRAEKDFYLAVRELPVDAQLAGQLGILDRIPLFTWHKAYVNRSLAHPFRPGYYAEIERRIRVVYDALYATDLNDVVTGLEREKIDYFVYDQSAFAALDPVLFEPLKSEYKPIFAAHRARGFALAHVPASAVVITFGGERVVSVQKLAAALSP